LFYSTRNLVERQVEIKHSANRARNQTSWVVDDIGPPIWNDARVNTKGNCGVAANLSKVGLNDHGAKFAPWWVPVIALGRGLFQLNISSEGARNDRTRFMVAVLDGKQQRRLNDQMAVGTQRVSSPIGGGHIFSHKIPTRTGLDDAIQHDLAASCTPEYSEEALLK
jgi:hypothetical protein